MINIEISKLFDELEKYKIILLESVRDENLYYERALYLSEMREKILRISQFDAIIEYDYFGEYIIDLSRLVGRFNKTRAFLITSLEEDRKKKSVNISSMEILKKIIPNKILHFERQSRHSFFNYISKNYLFYTFSKFSEIEDFVNGCLFIQKDFEFLKNFPNRIQGFILINSIDILKIWMYLTVVCHYLSSPKIRLEICWNLETTTIYSNFGRILKNYLDIISDVNSFELVDKYILQDPRTNRILKFIKEYAGFNYDSEVKNYLYLDDDKEIYWDKLNKSLIEVRKYIKEKKERGN